MTQLTANQLIILTASEVRTLSADDARKLAQSFKLKGAWNARKVELHDMLISYFASQEVSPEVEPEIAEVQSEVKPEVEPKVDLEAVRAGLETVYQSGPAVLVSDPLAEPAFNYQPTSGNFEAPIKLAGLLESKQAKKARESAAKKLAKANKPAKVKVDKTLHQLTHVTEAHLELIKANQTLTAESCSDPNRQVVKRDLLRQIVEDVTGHFMSEKVFNQVVVLASRKITRQALTIQSASRFRYLLTEVKEGQTFSPAVLVLETVLANPWMIQQAAHNYQTAAETGLEHINEWLNSKAN